MKLVFDEVGKRVYEAGVEEVVLYLMNNTGTYTEGKAWNGVTNIAINPDGGESNPLYADNIKYADIRSEENIKGSIEAFYYPDEFSKCNGYSEIATGVYASQQKRQPFGLCYKTKIGNDTQSLEYGYKLHLIYGATVAPSEKSYETIADSPEAIKLSWEYETIPVKVPGYKPTAHLELDSTKIPQEKMTLLINKLYGTDAGASGTPAETPPTLLTPKEVIDIVGNTVG